MQEEVGVLQDEIGQGSESTQRIRDKKKWQLALRRYILQDAPCEQYAVYFGIDSQLIRKWIECQFDEDTNWSNFGSLWQLEHIIPVTYFNPSIDEDLKLCWNFINIRAEKIHPNKNKGGKTDIIGARSYFLSLYKKTNYELCLKMVDKLDQLEYEAFQENNLLHDFIAEHKDHLEKVAQLNQQEFNRYNRGELADNILYERELFGKFAHSNS